jgi:hypothetical protein
MTKLSVALVCVLVTAAPALATEPAKDRVELAGRWEGPNYRLAARADDCAGAKCRMILDISPCGDGWCGVEVSPENKCMGTALTVAAGERTEYATVFKGRLELARGTEPYVVQAYLIPAANGDTERLDIAGDTGGEFRAFRRSFPFNAQLARAGEVHCKAEKPVS